MIITSGYFNPLHKGHIEYFHMARAHGDFLLVIINNDIITLTIPKKTDPETSSTHSIGILTLTNRNTIEPIASSL